MSESLRASLHACVLAAVALSACSEALLPDLSRVAADPSVAAPSVQSFLDERSIVVSWPEDRAAEQYILERALDSADPLFEVVYRGEANSIADSFERGAEGRYLYRLSPVRGRRLFGPSPAALGIASTGCRDSLEPNDTEAMPTSLEYEFAANLYYYRSYEGVEVRDVDWYAVDVPPRYRANIVITQIQPAPGGPSTALVFYLKGTTSVPVTNSLSIPIDNPSYSAKRFLFELSPAPEEILLDPGLPGGSMIDYTVALHSLVRL